MRVELFEKIVDIDDEERRMLEEMNIQPKDKRFKWRRIWFTPEDIFSLKEVNDKESIIEFNDGSNICVKGNYDFVKEKIQEAEVEYYDEEEEPTEQDMEL